MTVRRRIVVIKNIIVTLQRVLFSNIMVGRGIDRNGGAGGCNCCCNGGCNGGINDSIGGCTTAAAAIGGGGCNCCGNGGNGCNICCGILV